MSVRDVQRSFCLLGASALLPLLFGACSSGGDGSSPGGGTGAGGGGGTLADGGGSGGPGGSTGSGGGSSGDGGAGDGGAVRPVPPPSGPMGQVNAARLLNQATFGASYEDITSAATTSYDDWFTAQKNATISKTMPFFTTPAVAATTQPSFGGINGGLRNQIWLSNALNNPDQLRMRAAFALSEILVISDSGGLGFNSGAVALAGYLDLLSADAFGNFRQLLDDVTLNSQMGIWLSMMGNAGANNGSSLPPGVHADENYAREIMQLFTVGLSMLNLDGSVQMDATGNPVPSYTQAQVEDLARVFTGWGSYGDQWQGTNFGAAQIINSAGTQLIPMTTYPTYHDSTSKTIIGDTAVPAGQTTEADLKTALDTLFNHPNVGPFLGKQLIKKLVTSNPSGDYVSRVAQIFNDDGTGTRGNLFATLEAVLTDPEAIGGTAVNPAFGKLRESPLKMTDMYRAFHATTPILDPTSTGQLFNGVQFSYWPLDALTVFNYFQPDYQPPGPVTTAKEVAPELEVMTDNTIVSVSNSVDEFSGFYQGADGGVKTPASNQNGYDGVDPVLQLKSWESVGADPAKLVAQMNLVLMNDTMPADMQATLVTYATGVKDVDQRIADLVDLVVNSPQYSIQR